MIPIFIERFLQNVFFKRCYLCQRPHQGHYFCRICLDGLPWVEDRCWQCGVRLKELEHHTYCQRCIENPPPFDRTCALFSYEPPLSKMMAGFKFHRKLFYGKLFGELLLNEVISRWYVKDNLPEAIIPMPIHFTELRKRGYSHSVELALSIQKALSIPVLLDSYQRIENNHLAIPATLRKTKRNVQSMFEITKPSIQYQHVAIVDDLVTTGKTVRELARILKMNGVETIDIWCVCRS